MKRRYWIPILIVGAVIAGFLLLRPGPEPEGALVRTAVVETGPLRVWVTGTGKVEPAAQAALSFKTEGSLGELGVEVGQAVRAGDVLASLDADSLNASLLSAEADLIAAQQTLDDLLEGASEEQIAQAQMAIAEARDRLRVAEYSWNSQQEGQRASNDTIRGAEARLTLAEIEVDQAEDAYNSLSGRPSDDPAKALALTRLVAARADRDAALRNLNWYTGRPTEIQQALLDSEVSVAQAGLLQLEQDFADLLAGPDVDAVESAEARLRAAKAVVDQARLVSPIDGTVMSVNSSVGDTVVPGEIEIVIADLSSLHIDTTVDELDVGQVSIAQNVEITLDALPEVVLEGVVAGIDLSPEFGSSNTQYPVRVELKEVDDLVRVGMTAALSILVADEEGVVLVPNWALAFDPETDEIYVFVVVGDETERRALVLGLRNDAVSEVHSGLDAGETISATIEERQGGNGGLFFGGG